MQLSEVLQIALIWHYRGCRLYCPPAAWRISTARSPPLWNSTASGCCAAPAMEIHSSYGKTQQLWKNAAATVRLRSEDGDLRRPCLLGRTASGNPQLWNFTAGLGTKDLFNTMEFRHFLDNSRLIKLQCRRQLFQDFGFFFIESN